MLFLVMKNKDHIGLSQFVTAFYCLMTFSEAAVLSENIGSEKQENITEANEVIVPLCGYRSEEFTTSNVNRIVGGTNAKEREFKWQAAIQWRFQNHSHHVCGATIISESWLLTAAHCTTDFTIEDLIFVAGDHNVKIEEGFEQVRTAELIMEHEQYDVITQENDISLVKISEPFDFSSTAVAPICLPEPMQAFTGESCVATGWGKLKDGGSNAQILQKVWIPILDDETCRKQLKQLTYKGPLTENMLCAGLEGGGKDACQGDSGGPFSCAGPGELYVLAGIVSWGVGCAEPLIPGVYTEVSYFISWINEKLQQNSTNSTQNSTGDLVTMQNSIQFHIDKVKDADTLGHLDNIWEISPEEVNPSDVKKDLYPAVLEQYNPLTTLVRQDSSEESSEEDISSSEER